MHNCYFNDNLVIIYKNVKQVKNLKISQIANITGIKKHTLNARIKSNFPDTQIKRNKGKTCLYFFMGHPRTLQRLLLVFEHHFN